MANSVRAGLIQCSNPINDESVPVKKVQQAMLSLAPVELEKGVRANRPSGLDKMTDAEFEDLLGGWLKGAGLALRIDGELSGPATDKTIDAWNAERKAAAKVRK